MSAVDRDLIRLWLDVYKAAPGYIAASYEYAPGRLSTAVTFATDDLDPAATKIATLAASHNVWLRVTTLREPPSEGRGLAADSYALVGFWADVDIEGVGHKDAGYPPTIDDALAILDGLPEPTVILHSGGGLQVWWLFDEPWVLDGADDIRAAEDAAAGWIGLLQDNAAKWKVDSTGDLARILRPLGTLNHKAEYLEAYDQPLPVTIHRATGARYPREALVALLDGGEDGFDWMAAGVKRPYTDDDVIGDWSRRTDWADLLTPHEWALHHGARDGTRFWTRPGKSIKDGWSAITDGRNKHVLVQFSSNAGLPVSDRRTKLTKFRVFAILNHGGDGKAAYAAIAPDRKSSGEQRQHAHQSGQKAEWGTPDPIPTIPRTPLPPPSGDIGDMIGEVAVAYQVPRDLPFLTVLGILGICVGGRRRVRIAPHWTEVLSIYAAALLPSGERKSPVVAAMAAPLLEVEQELIEKSAPGVAVQRAYRDAHQAAIDKLKRKGDTSTEALAELDSMVRELAEMEVPSIPRLVIDDSTPEAMGRIMAEQDGRIGVLSTEAGLFAILAGRYSNGAPNLDLVLKAWSGDYCRVDRISRDPVVLEEPVLSIALSFQPDVLAGLAEAKHFRGAGLLARWLYALPASMVGRRATRPTSVSPAVAGKYAETIKALARSMRNSAETTEMHLTGLADQVLDAFRAELEPRMHPEFGDLADIADWANKLPGQLVRVAALLTLASDPNATVVDADVMRAAVGLAPYLIDHAQQAFDLMLGRRAPLEPARAVLRWIKRKKLTTFTVRDAWQGLRGQTWATSTGDVRDAIEDLEDRGWVRLTPPPKQSGGGRPASPCYETHPLLHQEFSR
jgi:hypothetical protein